MSGVEKKGEAKEEISILEEKERVRGREYGEIKTKSLS